MKKPSRTKLPLRTETIRALAPTELAVVHGGSAGPTGMEQAGAAGAQALANQKG